MTGVQTCALPISIEALQKIASPKIKVIRDDKEMKIDMIEIVPGDLILLEEGDIISADAKLIELFNLEIDESVLTGESNSVKKKIGEEVFRGSFVNSGNSKALVLRTGMKTKIGKIALKLQTIKEEKTQFEVEISKFSKKILYTISAIIFLMFFVSIFKYGLYQSILLSISLAVAAIPEGLPAILALTLAIGAKGMVKENALVRKLNVVESAGGIDIICTDKTGTLTKSEMKVTKIFVNNKIFDVTKKNKFVAEKIEPLLISGRLCNNSRIRYDEKGNKIYFGNQTEIALRKFSDEYIKENPKDYEKSGEISFNSKRKMMSVIYKKSNKMFIFSKGAPEILIEKCNRILLDGKIKKLDEKTKKDILEQNKKFASKALRVLGFAYREEKLPEKVSESDLIWLGLEAMIDPPREEVKESLRQTKTAGIRVIMMTGDNPLTAKAIAEEIGLDTKGVIDGRTLKELDNKELEKRLKQGVNIFARVSPFDKLRILEILKKEYRVAMTGDGVNDALALKKADVGIAMNIRGTEVAKQASDIILLDDNFKTIVFAIKEGRRSFDNIRKFINYLFVSNLAEVGVLFLATLFLTLKRPILLPIQILWINLLTDGFPALALGADPARPDIMNKPPRKKKEPIINKRLTWLIGTIGIKKMLILFITFFLIWKISGIEQAGTALFTGFILYEFVRIGTIRYQEKLTWLSNKWLVGALLGSLVLQFIIIYTPLNSFFHIVRLNYISWIILITGVLIGYFSAIWITKIVIKYVKD